MAKGLRSASSGNRGFIHIKPAQLAPLDIMKLLGSHTPASQELLVHILVENGNNPTSKIPYGKGNRERAVANKTLRSQRIRGKQYRIVVSGDKCRVWEVEGGPKKYPTITPLWHVAISAADWATVYAAPLPVHTVLLLQQIRKAGRAGWHARSGQHYISGDEVTRANRLLRKNGLSYAIYNSKRQKRGVTKNQAKARLKLVHIEIKPV